MRINCNDIGDFEKNIENPGTVVFNKSVWVSITKHIVGDQGGAIKDAAKVRVVFNAGCILWFQDEGQGSIEFAFDCGVDYQCEGDCPASKDAENMKKKIEELCKKHNLACLPGIMDPN